MVHRLNRYLFFYGEFFAAALLLYFAKGVPLGFFIGYAFFLAVIALTKHLIFAATDEYTDTSFTSTALFLCEFAPIFLTFANVCDAQTLLLCSGGVILMLLSVRFGAAVSCDFALAAAGCAAVAMIAATKTIEGALLLFSILMTATLLYAVYSRFALPAFVVSTAIPAAILVRCHEFGTLLIMLFSLVLIIYITGSKAMKLSLTGLIVVTFAVWIAIYRYDVLYERLLNISSSSSWQRVIPRIFYRADEESQQYLLKKLVFGRGIFGLFSTVFSPGNYTDIISYPSDEFTSCGDYLFSVLTFYASPYSFIIVILCFAMLVSSIRRNIDTPQIILVSVLISRCVIHVFGNISIIVPFTGIPFAFLSHGHSCVLASAIIVALLTVLEQHSDHEE